MFDRMGVVEATHPEARDTEEAAIEAGAQNVEAFEKSELGDAAKSGAIFYCDSTDLATVSKALTSAGWIVTSSELRYVGKNSVELAGVELAEVNEFLEAIDDNDDVHRIFAAIKA
jgi:transcriptional/translational regulatory protein YebC/TACO1